MAYKITVQDGPVTVTVETDVADDAAAALAGSVLQKVQRSKSFDPPLPWRGPDGQGADIDMNLLREKWARISNDAGRLWETQFYDSPYARAERAVAKHPLCQQDVPGTPFGTQML